MNLLGIDVGTSGTRAVLIDERGRIVHEATAEHAAFASPQAGWAEQDARDWWRATCVAVREIVVQVSADEIGCVGFSGQMHGTTLLDERDEPLRPAIIWCDVRSDAECRRLTEQIGAERLIELVANPALENFTLTKLLWVREHEPEVWRRVRSVLLPKDYVRLRLTGERATDAADASGTLMFDVRARAWSNEMLNATGIRRELLPRVYESPEVTGEVSEEGAAATGLRAGTPVVAGAGDQAAGAVGLGITKPGAVSSIIGTSGVVFAATDTASLDPRGRVHTFCHAIPDRWHVMGVTQAAGLSLRWLRDLLDVKAANGRGAYNVMCDEAANVPPGADGVVWLPYLMGERTPHLDPHARGALLGLTARHTRAHVTRAVLEGVAHSLRDTLTIFAEMRVPVESIRVGGGGARSALWRQVQADVFGRSVETVETEEGAAYGAAILAGVGAKIWSDVDTACAGVVRTRERAEPDSESVEIMNRRYEVYRSIYPALRGVV